MEKKGLVELSGKWIRHRVRVMMLCLSIVMVFWIVQVLSQVPLELIYYTTKLIGFIGIIISIWDFIKYKKRYDKLLEVYHNLDNGLEGLGEPTILLEDIYQDLLKACNEKREEIFIKAKNQESEVIDYYTLWVHQIKVPITALDLLLEDSGSPKQDEMKEELFRIENYVDMALQYLRIESISQDMILKKYDLYPIVKEVIKKHAMTFIRKQISIEFEPFTLEVYTDEKWIRFVIEQLVANSLKYTPKGAIKITVKDGIEKVLMIQDTGMGIEKEDLPRIFDKGFTGYNGRMNKKSTGLGLYLCKEVTKKLSHQLQIDSEVGKGTLATIGFYEELVTDF